jgi:predicted AAA+ superfamily ATPase
MQEQLLIYGMYPNSVLAENDAERRDFLWELVDSLLLKDILRFQEIKGSDFLLKLLRLLAFQIGSEVSLEELGKNLGISKNTASRYLDLLEKSYIIFRLSGFNRNLRNEIKKMPKYYFYDIGVRNAVINNFNPVSMRDDIGKLWENFALGERIKFCAYSQVRNNYYFWRTWEQQEIDLIEETGGTLSAFEFKYSSLRPIAAPKKFRQAYPSANYEVISSGNFIDFVTNKRKYIDSRLK